MNRVEYISKIQPPYGIVRYKYYEVIEKNNKCYIINDFNKEIEHKKDSIKKDFRPEVSWDKVFKIEEKKVKKVKTDAENKG